jgi:hypothetical protein
MVLPDDAPSLIDQVPERIAEVAAEARFIYMLRDSVKRAASTFRHALCTALLVSGAQTLLVVTCPPNLPALRLACFSTSAA